jgi:hypothetical protein
MTIPATRTVRVPAKATSAKLRTRHAVQRLVLLAALVYFSPTLHGQRPPVVLVEAEGFPDTGGWVLDQQSMDVMGSSYLLAHGLGVPVRDAVTTVRFPSTGVYRLFVRTRDWVPGHGPGKFQLLVNGTPAPAVFGASGDRKWDWQPGGTVNISKLDATLALKDLTGFEGRCDAILFAKTTNANWRPPNEVKALEAFRRTALQLPARPGDGGDYDFVAVGGGFAGIGASVAAARLGLKVALIQDRPVLGGNASSEIGVNPIGDLDFHLYPRNADIVKDLEGGNDARQLEVVRAEKNISLFLNMRAFRVDTRGGRIVAVVARDTRTLKELRFRAPLFADCTGDAVIGVLAGAEWRMGREAREQTGETFAPDKADRQLLGNGNYWRAKQADRPAPFPACPWAIQVNEESFDVPRPKYPPKGMPPGMLTAGVWNWESGFNRDPVTEAEYIRDHNLRAIYGVWDFLKNRSKDKEKYVNWRLDWVGYVLGKRESRRLIGDHVITQQDLEENAKYPDGIVVATWYVDLHFPHPENSKFFPGEEFRSIAYDDPNFAKYQDQIPGRELKIKPFPIPYRCFYSKNVPNLFMAGRNISATHVGLAPVRVMKTTAMMGTVVGRAAYFCRTHGVDPRAIYERYLEAFKNFLKNPKAD